MNEPKTVYIGDSYDWLFTDAAYPSSEWALTYYIVGAATGSFTGSAYDAVSFAVSMSSTVSGGLVTGSYSLIAVVASGSSRHTLYEVAFDAVPDPSTLAAGYDTRSHAVRTLDLIETAIENYATNPVQTLTIAGRTRSNWGLSELLKWRSYYEQLVRREEAEERINAGAQGKHRILVRFK